MRFVELFKKIRHRHSRSKGDSMYNDSIDVTAIDDAEYDSMNAIHRRYLLLKRIGNREYCEVWKCRDRYDGKEYAIKLYTQRAIPDYATQNVVSMYQLFTRLRSPYLLPIINCISENGHTYILMPLCKKGSIESLAGTFSEKELWKLIHDIAGGLSFIHTNDIIHMDVKPSNILCYNNTYVLSDFGISVKIKEIIYNVDKYKTLGAVSYMSPEHFIQDGNLTSASDIWALGATIYTMAVGVPPFDGLGGRGQLLSISEGISLGERFSDSLNHLVASCLCASGSSRPSATMVFEIAQRMIDSSTGQTVSLRGGEYMHRSTVFLNNYSAQALRVYEDLRILQDPSSLLFGIMDIYGNTLVDFIYDKIYPFGETAWPGPGPCPPREDFFLGAFFRQREFVGYLFIKEDGAIEEYGRCTQKRFMELSTMT